MGSDSTDIETGDELVIDIQDTGKEGDGIAHTEDGFVLVVPEADIGERVRVRIDTVDDDHALADPLDEQSGISS